MTGMRVAAAVAMLLLATGCSGDDSPEADDTTPTPGGTDPTEQPAPEETTNAQACPRAESQASTLLQGWQQVVAADGNTRGAVVAEDFAAAVAEVSDLIGATCRGDSQLGGLEVQADLVAEQAQDGPVPRAVMVATATTGNAWLASIKVDDQRFRP
jgi:hypothetical protein